MAELELCERRDCGVETVLVGFLSVLNYSLWKITAGFLPMLKKNLPGMEFRIMMNVKWH